MAANEIKLTLKVNDDNTLSIVGKKAKDAAAGVDKLDKSSKNLNKTQNQTYRNMQGVAGTSSNLTKNFSKMQQGIGGGLVPAYAALAARIFAVTALFNVLQRAAAVTQLEQGLIAVGNAAGQNLPYVADRLREISGLAVSSQQAMQATALATSAGFSTTQLEKLTKVAKGASLALGRDMGDALDRLVRGTAKLEPEILDELGIMVRLDDAVSDYAVSLQKSAGDLTQFERRQAFLNATIDQGTKKFDDIAEVVDVNPYDKLAATFDDLSKTIINFGNKALLPIVDYLSNAPGALIGILALMGKTITNELTPALGELSSRAAENAEAFASHAESLKKQTIKDYRKIGKTIDALDFAPDSLKNAAGAYKEGSRGLKEMQKDLTALKISESSRATALTKYRADNSKYSAEFIAQKELEEQQVKAVRQELERLIAVEQGRGGVPVVSAAATNAGVQANQEGIVAAGIGGMTGSIANDFSKAKEGTKDLAKEVKGATGVFGKFKAIGGLAGGSLRLFGAAFGSLLGPLGIAITAFGLLTPLISKFFEKTAQQKAMDEISESFESFTTIAIRLNKVIREEGTESFNAYYASMKAGTGILQQVQAGVTKAIEASQSELKESLNEANQDLGEAYSTLAKQEQALQQARADGRGLKTYERLEARIRGTKRTIEELEAATLSLTEKTGKFDKESQAAAASVIDLALARMKASGLGEFMTEEVTELKSLRKALLEGSITQQEFNKRMEELDDRTASFTAGISAAEQASSNLSKEMTALGDKPTTAFSKIRDEAKLLANELAETGEKGQEGFLADKGQAKQFSDISVAIAKVGKTQEFINKLRTEEYKGLSITAATFKFYSETISEAETKMVTLNSESKKAAETAKQMAKFSKDNAFFKEQEIKFERESLKKKKEALEAERSGYDLTKTTPDILKRVQELDAEILALNEKITNESEDQAQIEIARIQGLQRINKALSKQSSLMISLQGAQQDLARRRIEMSNAELGISGLTAQDEADILKASAEAQKKEEEKAFRLKLEAINLEHELLKQQFLLEELKMHNLLDRMVAEEQMSPDDAAKQKSAISTTISALSVSSEANRNLQMQIAAAKFGITIKPEDITFDATTGKIEPGSGLDALIANAITQGDLAGQQAELAASEAKRLKTLERLSVEAETARASGNEQLALGKELEAQELKRTHLSSKIANLRLRELQDTETQEARNQKIRAAEDENNQNEQDAIKTRIALRALETEQITRTGGAVAGGFATLINGIQDLSEEGGVLSDKSTASLGDKIAAVREKSQPLIDHLKTMGPEGEVMSAVVQGAFTMGEVFSDAFDIISSDSEKMTDKVQAGIQAAGAAIGVLGQIQQAKSAAAVAAIDDEIKAEQKRDGKSAQSIQKIKQLEAKKEQMQRKAFNDNKKVQMAQIIAATAVSVMKSFENAGGFPAGIPMAAAMAALGAVQLAAVASTSYKGGGSKSPDVGGAPKAVTMGKRSNVVDVSQRASSGELAFLRGSRGMGTNANNFNATPAFYGSKKMRAYGGAVAGYTVGEQGPELFVPEVPGQIVPSDDVPGTGTPVSVTFNVQAIDSSSFNDALSVQRGNIISIIREAANSSGEEFLENVDTMSLQIEAESAKYGISSELRDR